MWLLVIILFIIIWSLMLLSRNGHKTDEEIDLEELELLEEEVLLLYDEEEEEVI